MTDEMEEFFGKPIDCVTREDLIQSGDLVDVTETAREAGISFPVAISRAVWGRYVEFDPESEGQDEAGRLWDILHMFKAAVTANTGGDPARIEFKLYVVLPPKSEWRDNEKKPGPVPKQITHRLVTLKAMCGPGDNREPVITILLPNED